jgi:hypothetical protein
MKHITAILFFALLIAMVASASAQSLADIAEKEKQRREGIQETPEVITNDKVPEYTGGSVSTVAPEATPSDETGSGNAKSAKKTEGTEGTEAADREEDAAEAKEAQDTGKTVDPDEPVDFNGRPESYWRETMAAARQKVKDLENEGNVIELRLNDLQNQFYNTGDGFRRENIQKEIQKAFYERDLNKENLAKAKGDLEDLEREARKSGALPGWIEGK